MAKFVVFASWSDVPHIDEASKKSLLMSYLPHERKARTEGVPSLGAGAIYPIDESEVIVEPFIFPAWYRHVFALDVGWNRTAAVWGAFSPDEDIVYIYSELYASAAEPAIHAAAIKARGEWIPGVVDPASRGRSQHDGEQLFEQYKTLGLALVPAKNAVEAGLLEVWQRLSTGRLKFFSNMRNLLGEYRIYRRDMKGKIVKENDHALDCVRYLCMSGVELATVRPFDQWAGRPGMPQIKKERGLQSSYDPLAAAWSVAVAQKNESPAPGWMPGALR